MASITSFLVKVTNFLLFIYYLLTTPQNVNSFVISEPTTSPGNNSLKKLFIRSYSDTIRNGCVEIGFAFEAPSIPYTMRISTHMRSQLRSYGDEKETEDNCGGIYHPFADYAWSKLAASGLVEAPSLQAAKAETKAVPADLQYQSSTSKDGSDVSISVESCTGSDGSTLRLARSALIETTTSSYASSDLGADENEKGMDMKKLCQPNGIHVLNLVLFPEPKCEVALPVLGMDLVTLPGGKHLIAIDFQPILPPNPSSDTEEESHRKDVRLFSEKYNNYEERIANLHRKHVLDQSDVITWGGDIPPAASRFFSPYALWTRLKGDEGLVIIRKEIYAAFCEYLDLYLELLTEVQLETKKDMLSPSSSLEKTESKKNSVILQGQRDYIKYRQVNDPARPMLKRLYGEEWAERVISEVLFKMI